MKHLGLFEGIGGFSLAAHWMGWETIAWCEWDEKCQSVLKRHFPEAIGHGNIKETDFKPYANKIDILTGGFPCQSFSVAGKGALDLSLWQEMFRSICEAKPRWVVAENVPGIISRGNGSAIESVYEDLENAGYEMLPPIVLPAGAVGSPQYRYRVWIVAHSNKIGRRQQEKKQIQPRRSTAELCSWWSVEPSVGRVAYGLPNQLDRGQQLGNAIVPQVALQIFKTIEQYESLIPLTNPTNR